MQARTEALNNKTNNIDKSEELEDDAELSNKIKVPVDSFFTRRDVLAMIADDTKRATGAMLMESITNTVEHTIADLIQVEYTS